MTEPVDFLLIYATLVTQDARHTVIEDGGLAVNEGRIVACGPSESLLARFQPRQTLDAGRRWAIPGFINTHNHLFQTFMRGLGKDETFLNWIATSVRRLLPFVDEESIYLAAMTGCLEAVRTGTTTIVDYMYAHIRPQLSDAVVQAFIDLGLRGVLARGICDLEKFPNSSHRSLIWEPIDQCLADADRLQARYKDYRHISTILAPGSVWNMTRHGLEATAQYARAHGMPVTMHLLESRDDDEYCLAQYGARTMPFLEEIGFLGPQFVAVHTIRLLPEDMDLMQKYGVKVSHNPLSNMLLGNGVCPVPELVRRGIKIGLGTDGAASNDSQNMIETMKVAAILQKAVNQDAAVLSARAVFSMATDQGAEVMGMEQNIGSLEVGKCADFVLVDLHKPNTTPSYDLISSLVYSGSEGNIYAVVVDGQVIYKDGHFTRVDEEDILQRAERKAQEMYQRSEQH